MSKSATRVARATWRAASAARSVVDRSRWARTSPRGSSSRCSSSRAPCPSPASASGTPGAAATAPARCRSAPARTPPRGRRARRGRRCRPGRRATGAHRATRWRARGSTPGAEQAEREAAGRPAMTTYPGRPPPGLRARRPVRPRPAGRRRGGRRGSGRVPASRWSSRCWSPTGGTRVANSPASPRDGETSQPVTSRQNATPTSYAGRGR